jgi:UDP-N-acetylglucosamine--N-acetylmuramyl-(pentapeptide) pyrophosphoryl-undecaprenol N-acetylglucosamine transferase
MAFVDRMDLVYRAADLMVARAGASTISELQLTGVPAVLVPSPNVAEDHQRKNAQALADRDAAVMVLDVDAETSLAEVVTSLLNDDARLKSLRTNVAKMGQRNSDERIVDEIYKITQ